MRCLGLTFVAVGHEGHGADDHLNGPTADHGVDRCTDGASIDTDVAHGNCLVDGWCQQAAGDLTNDLALFVL